MAKCGFRYRGCRLFHHLEADVLGDDERIDRHALDQKHIASDRAIRAEDCCEALTKWLAMVEVDEESGCVCYVRDSHNRAVTLGFSQRIVEFPNREDKAAQAAYQLKLTEDLKSSEKIWHGVHARSKSLVG